MKKFIELVDTGGGHIIVALFLVCLGVGLLLAGHDYGKEIAAGALGSLWTALRWNASNEAKPQ